MRFSPVPVLAALAAVRGAVAAPVESTGDAALEARQNPHMGDSLGGTFMILGDHFKYTMNPPSAKEPIPAALNSPPREAHRMAHAALVP